MSVVMDHKGEILIDPEVELTGLPLADRDGHAMLERILDAIDEALDSIPKARRRDPEVVRESVRRAVRANVASAWGKKPNCAVLISVL